MAAPGVSQSTNPGSASHGFAYKQVQVMSIDGNMATVQDSLTKTFPVSITNMRAKGVPPLVGERWLLDRQYGAWTFAVCLSTPLTIPQAAVDGLPALSTQVAANTSAITALNTMPYCKVSITSSFSYTPASTNAFAFGGWAPMTGDDPDGLFKPPDGTSIYSRIVVAKTMRYRVRFRFVFTGYTIPTGGATFVSFVTKQTPDVSNSIARDARAATPQGGDGTSPVAEESVKLNAGDILYFGVWGSVTATAPLGAFGVSSNLLVEATGLR